MGKIIKHINLKDFQCLRTNPNLMVWDLTGDIPQMIPNVSGVGAILEAEINKSAITKINVIHGGEGYTNNTTISIINNGDKGFGAIAEPIIVNGVITEINIINGGYAYEITPDVIANDTTHYNICANIIIPTNQPFNPYTTTTVKSTATSSTYNIPKKTSIFSIYDCIILYNDLQSYQNVIERFCKLCSLNDGSLLDIKSDTNLSQYINAIENWNYKEGSFLYPYLHYLVTEDFLEEYSVTYIHVTDGGNNYSSVPKVTITEPIQGVGAEATAVISGKVVTQINIDTNKNGSGYTIPPKVLISGGGGNGAQAICAIGDPTNVFFTLEYYTPKNANRKTFLEYLTNSGKIISLDIFGVNFNITLSLHALTKTTQLNNNLLNFVKEYISSQNKIEILIGLIHNHIITLDSVNEKFREFGTYNISSDLRTQCYYFVLSAAWEYFTENFSCEKIQETNRYEYVFDEEPPKIKLPIILSSNINDIGVLSKPVKHWEIGKRYYKNDLVMFDGYTYILKNDNNGDGFAGVFNPLDNVIYFDEFHGTDIYTGSLVDIVEPIIVEITSVDGNGSGAKVLATGIGSISNFIIQNGGSGYTKPPLIKIIGGGGTGARARSVITDGVVSSIVLESGGSGYTKNKGFFNSYIVDDYGNYRHWHITIGHYYDKNKIKCEGESLLYKLRSYQPKTSAITWFDVEGVYQKDLLYNTDRIDKNAYYRSYIKDISYKDYNDKNEITSYDQTALTWTNDIAVRRVATYVYMINEIVIGSEIRGGLKYTDTITIELINSATDTWTKPTIETEIEYQTHHFQDPKYPLKGEGVDYSEMKYGPEEENMIYDTNSYKNPPYISKNDMYEHMNKEVWEYTTLIKEEHLFGIATEPRVENDISVKRHIAYSFDKHTALGEVKNFEQMLTYNNGSFWKIYNNTKKVDD